MTCETCGRGTAGLLSALAKLKTRNKKLRNRVAAAEAERDEHRREMVRAILNEKTYQRERTDALRQRDEMAVELIRSKRREAALSRVLEETRAKHELLTSDWVALKRWHQRSVSI